MGRGVRVRVRVRGVDKKNFFGPFGSQYGLKLRGARGTRAPLRDPLLIYYISYSSNYASLFSMELEKQLINDKIPISCLTNMPPKHYFKRYKQQK